MSEPEVKEVEPIVSSEDLIRNAMLFAVEGPMGAGKSTAAAYLAEYLNSKGIPAEYVNPYDVSALQHALHAIDNNDDKELHIDAMSHAFVEIASLRETMHKKIVPLQSKGVTVILDEWVMRVLVNDCIGGGVPEHILDVVRAPALGTIHPNATFMVLADSTRCAENLMAKGLTEIDMVVSARRASGYQYLYCRNLIGVVSIINNGDLDQLKAKLRTAIARVYANFASARFLPPAYIECFASDLMDVQNPPAPDSDNTDDTEDVPPAAVKEDDHAV